MSIELVRGGGRFKRDPTEGAESAGGRGLLQMIRTDQARVGPSRKSSKCERQQSTTTILFSPTTSPPAKSASTVRKHLVITPRHFRQKCF